MLLGFASHKYASARAQSIEVSNDHVEQLATDPGTYNAWTFSLWWAGVSGLLFAAVLFAGALANDPRMMREYRERLDAR